MKETTTPTEVNKGGRRGAIQKNSSINQSPTKQAGRNAAVKSGDKFEEDFQKCELKLMQQFLCVEVYQHLIVLAR